MTFDDVFGEALEQYRTESGLAERHGEYFRQYWDATPVNGRQVYLDKLCSGIESGEYADQVGHKQPDGTTLGGLPTVAEVRSDPGSTLFPAYGTCLAIDPQVLSDFGYEDVPSAQYEDLTRSPHADGAQLRGTSASQLENYLATHELCPQLLPGN